MPTDKVPFKPLLGHSFSGLLFPSFLFTPSPSFLSRLSIRHWWCRVAIHLACVSSDVTFCFLARSSFNSMDVTPWAGDLPITRAASEQGSPVTNSLGASLNPQKAIMRFNGVQRRGEPPSIFSDAKLCKSRKKPNAYKDGGDHFQID